MFLIYIHIYIQIYIWYVSLSSPDLLAESHPKILRQVINKVSETEKEEVRQRRPKEFKRKITEKSQTLHGTGLFPYMDGLNFMVNVNIHRPIPYME